VEFLDTNILIYAASGRPTDRIKSQIARKLVTQTELAISVQVLDEFYAVSRNPRKLDFSHSESIRYCTVWKRFFVVEPTLSLFDAAAEFVKRYEITIFDASILAAAQTAGCKTVYSEDLSHEQLYGKIRVINPFL